MKMEKLVEFKGVKGGLIIQMNAEEEFEHIILALREKIAKSGDFFKNANVIGTDGRTMTTKERTLMRTAIAECDLVIKSLDIYSIQEKKDEKKEEEIKKNNEKLKTYRETIKKLKEESLVKYTKSLAQKDSEIKKQIDLLKESTSPKFVKGTLRSGRSIVHNGDIIIVGDVNPGAEIIADGNIIVMGNLRGVAHAGSAGKMDAFVCALKLQPMQLRIASIITRPPDDEDSPENPEIAFIKDNVIMIETYL